MISQLAEERLRKLRTALDAMDADPEILFYRCRQNPVIGVLIGPPVTEELINEIQIVVDAYKKKYGWK